MSEPAAKPRPMINLDEFERRLRRPAAAPQSHHDDPLAELARLVGGHEDPFKSVFEQDGRLARAQGATLAPQEVSPEPQPEAFAPDAIEPAEPAFHGTIHPQAFARAEPAMTPAAHQADYYQAPAEEQDYAWPEREERIAPVEQHRSRRPLFAAGAIFLVGVLGIGASFAYKSKSGPHEIATIQAMSGPTKIQPDSPGGVDVPNQDASILDKGPQQTPTKLANHEERPVDLTLQQPAATPNKVAMADTGSSSSGAAGVPVPPPPAGPQAQSATGPAPQSPIAAPATDIQSYGIGALIEPKRVKTVSVRSDGTVLPNDTPPQMPASASQLNHTAAQVPAATAPKPAATPKSTARVVTTPKPAPTMEQLADNNDAPAAAPAAPATPAPLMSKPKPAPVKPVKVAATEPPKDSIQDSSKPEADGAGGFAVQFAAPGSEQEAHEMTAKLAAKFSGDLSGHHLTYHRAKVNDKTVFRVRAGGMTREEATSICEKVKSGGGSCFVAKG